MFGVKEKIRQAQKFVRVKEKIRQAQKFVRVKEKMQDFGKLFADVFQRKRESIIREGFVKSNSIFDFVFLIAVAASS